MCKRQSTFLPLYFCLFYNETAARERQRKTARICYFMDSFACGEKLGLRPQTVSPRRRISSHEISQMLTKFCLCLSLCSGFSVKFCNSTTKKLFQNQFRIFQQLLHYIVEKRFNCLFPVRQFRSVFSGCEVLYPCFWKRPAATG